MNVYKMSEAGVCIKALTAARLGYEPVAETTMPNPFEDRLRDFYASMGTGRRFVFTDEELNSLPRSPSPFCWGLEHPTYMMSKRHKECAGRLGLIGVYTNDYKSFWRCSCVCHPWTTQIVEEPEEALENE